MSRRDQSKGFTRVGAVDLRESGLAVKHARRLRLDRAWAMIAGEAIGRRAKAGDIRRGVLEIEIGDPAWARELAPLLPKLVARIAREFPDLGVKKFRTTAAGATLDRAASFPPDEEARREPAPPAPRPKPAGPPPEEAGLSPGDLLDVATRYLERVRAAKRIR